MTGARTPITTVGRVHGSEVLYVLCDTETGRPMFRVDWIDGGIAPRHNQSGFSDGRVYIRVNGQYKPVPPSEILAKWLRADRVTYLEPARTCTSCQRTFPNDTKFFAWSWVGPQKHRFKLTGPKCLGCCRGEPNVADPGDQID